MRTAHPRTIVIEPTRGWRMLDWRELWAYRELLWVLTSRDVRVRYKQSLLGAAWALLRPVLTMLIFTAVFGFLAKIPSDGYPYPIFVFSGLLPWSFFAAAIASSANSLIGSANLVSKVYFPRLILPFAALGAPLVDMLVAGALLLPMMYWYGLGWSQSLLAIPLLMLGVMLAALGVGTLLAALTVSYRDFTHITPFLIQIWMYVTPVIYSSNSVPEKWRWVLFVNPLAALVEGFRCAFLGRPLPWPALGWSFSVSILALLVGVAYFERVERRFADVI